MKYFLAFIIYPLLIAAVIVFTCPAIAPAHMHNRPDLDEWLRTLYSKLRGSCCDSSEAETMADPDWKYASEFKESKCESSRNANNESATYCVRLQNPHNPDDWRWWDVPDGAVVEFPNRAGPALIWLVWDISDAPYIRCFLPGALS
jgi:hypothetical protein